MNLRSLGILAYVGAFLLRTTPTRAKIRRLSAEDPAKADALSHRYVKQALSKILDIAGVTVETEGLSRIPDEPCLYVANHRSYFDIMVTETVIPSGVGYVSKDTFQSIPGLAAWMELIHCVFLNREDPKEGIRAILKGAEYLKSGRSMLIFPEGTRSKTGALGEFKGGSLKMAQKAKCPIVPVAISGTGEIFEDNPRLSVRPSKVRVTFGEPVYIAKLSRTEQKAQLTEIRESIAKMLVKPTN